MVFVWSLVLLQKFLFLYSLFSLLFTTCFPEIQPKCHQYESHALLQFKEGFVINNLASDNLLGYPKTASWNSSTDCCSWDGIKCHEHTDHVIHVDLSSSQLYGTMDVNSSLFRLVHLRVLDLSDNDFNYSQIPSKIGKLSQLKYLNLSLSLFYGEIPPQVSQLSKLRSLDLGFRAIDSPKGSTGNLLQLKLSDLKSIIKNSTKLEILFLSYVTISSTLPDTLTNLTSLKELSLYNSDLYGEFPVGIFHLPNLKVLDLRYNPSSLGNLTQLVQISLKNNKFKGDPSASLANLTKLSLLNVGLNEFTIETISWVGKLSSVVGLDISSVNIGSDIPLSFANLTQLEVLIARNSNIKGEIPSWIMNLTNLVGLNLRSNFLHGKIDLDTFLKLKKLVFLNLSFNKLSLYIGQSSSHMTDSRIQVLQLASCNFVEIPTFIRDLDDLEFLMLSNNNISSLPNWLWKKTSLQSLDVSHNSLAGEISPSICNLKSLATLDLSFNNLRGNIPSFLGNFSQSLENVDLNGNKLFGLIPQTYMIENSFQQIDLSNNKLQGQLPRALVNNRRLEFLDVSYNNINDSFPFWMGELPELKVLSLSNNEFHGDIRCPSNMTCTFPKLHIIDLSHNEFSGSFPSEMIQSWKAMKTSNASQLQYEQKMLLYSRSNNSGEYHAAADKFYSFTMSNKGLTWLYEKLQEFYSLMAIDISSNKISGEIPQVIGDLKGLVLLNLSNNLLIGSIPSSVGKLSNLETLDLSHNSLSGKIPQQLAEITFLEFLDVSFNNLTGPIPQNNQFSTFKGDSFEGNQGLCGDQLLKKCIDRAGPSTDDDDDDDDDDSESFFELYWTVVLIGYGGGLVAGVALGNTYFPQVFAWCRDCLGVSVMILLNKIFKGH